MGPVRRGDERGLRAARDLSESASTRCSRRSWAAGFEALDLWLAHLNWRWATPEHVPIARDLLDRHGLRVVSLAGNFGATPAELESACRLANALDVDLLGGMGDVLRHDRPAAESVLREHGVRFGYENHPERSPQEVLELIGDADDVLGAAVDTGWWATQGYDPVQAIRDLRGRLFHVHLKDVEAPGNPHLVHARRGRAPRSRTASTSFSTPATRGALTIEHEPYDRDPTGEVIRMREQLEARLRQQGRAIVSDRRFASRSSAAATSPARTARRPRPIRASRSPARRTSTGAERGVRRAVRRRRLPDLEALLADPTVDAVVNLTSHGMHAEVTTAALEAGKHVHSEKPMAGDYAEARGLVELADAKGVRLSCSPITFMGDAQETAWSLVASGAIGNVRVVYAEVNWGRIETWHPRPEPFYAIGPMADVGVYPLTFLTAIFGPARRVTAHGQIVYPDRFTNVRRAVHGRRARFRRRADRARGRHARATDDELLRRPAEQAARDRVPRRHRARCSSRAGRTSTRQVELAPFGGTYEPVPVPGAFHGVDWGKALAELAAAISEERPHRATGAHAAHVVEILDAVETSVREGKTVDVTSTFAAPPAPAGARRRPRRRDRGTTPAA